MEEILTLASGDAEKPVFSLDALRTRCASCNLRELCLPVGLSPEDMDRLDKVIRKRQRIAKGELLYRQGDPFLRLFAVRVGHFKTYQVTHDGEQQITGFQMPGEILGLDAISSGKHQCDAKALEDSEVCEILYSELEQLFVQIPALLRQFHRLMSQEITRDQSVMLLLGNMASEQRFSAFLVNLSSRYAARGYASTSLQLRMGREEIGNYLGLTIESVSRLVAKFKKAGLLEVSNREVRILDLPRMREIASGSRAFDG
jgi:CRP/FNR family transcriptional regulator